jgi:hypothetical protein
MLSLLLMAGVLVAVCVIAFMLMNRLMHSAQRLNALRDEMTRNDDLLQEQVKRLAALQDAQASDKTSENPREN